MLRSFLKQVVQCCPLTPECVVSLYDRYQGDSHQPPVGELRNSLQTVARLCSRVFLVLDALDECSSTCRVAFLADVFELQATADISVFATSRPIPDVTGWFKSSSRVEIKASHEDVCMYLDARMSQLRPSSRPVRDLDLRQEVLKTIELSVKGM